MRKRAVFDGQSTLETPDLRLSLSSLSLGAPLAPPVFSHHLPEPDGPLPDPESPMDTGPTSLSTPTSGPFVSGSS
jgi:hypothetical protein